MLRPTASPLRPYRQAEQGGGRGGSIGTIAGAIIGTIIGIYTPLGPFLGASLGATVGGLIGGTVDYLTAADVVNKQAEIADLQVQTSQYGTPIPQVFGTYRLAGNIIWIGPKVVHTWRSSTRRKGKGKGPANVNIRKTYTVDLAVAICDTQVSGPMDGIARIYADGTLIYDRNQPDPTGKLPRMIFHRGDAEQTWDIIMGTHLGPEQTPGYPFLCYVVLYNYNMGDFPRVPNFTFVVYQNLAHDMPLPELVERLAVAGGLPATALDLTRLPTDTYVRFMLNSVGSVRAALEQLMTVYRFFLFDSGAQLIAKTMDLDEPVGTIPEAELDVVESAQEQTVGMQVSRERTRALPTELIVTYPSPHRDYQAGAQTAMFSSLASTEAPRSVQTAVALDDQQAKDLAQQTLDRIWIERTAFQWTTSRKWAALQVGDRVTIASRNALYNVTIHEVSYGRNGIMEYRGRNDSTQVMFVEGALAGTGPGYYTELAYVLETLPVFLDLPAMSSEDVGPRLYVIYTYERDDDSWPGATLHESFDGGEAYLLMHVAGLQAITGLATTILPDAPWWLTDRTSTLTIELEYGTLHSLLPQQFQAGAYHAMLGNELIQFREAELIAPKTYALRHFWRGRRGTGWATGTHVASERITIIDSAVYRIEQQITDRYVPRLWKAVTAGLEMTDATEVSHTMVSENLKPWSVASLLVEHDGDDWVLSWRGRARFTGYWIDGSQATPDPDFLTYRIVIYNGAAIARQVEQGDSGDYQARQVFVYTAAQQLEDFGSLQTTLAATVLQVGRNDVSRPAAA